MTQEDKELLLKDLCARLPYKVKGNYQNSDDELLRKVTIMYRYLEPGGMVMTGDIKPYLFPLSSMSEEQRYEFLEVITPALIESISDCVNFTESVTLTGVKSDVVSIDWLNKNHFDYNDLISKGLAIDATGLNIY